MAELIGRLIADDLSGVEPRGGRMPVQALRRGRRLRSVLPPEPSPAEQNNPLEQRMHKGFRDCLRAWLTRSASLSRQGRGGAVART